jgi:hypothetical protein
MAENRCLPGDFPWGTGADDVSVVNPPGVFLQERPVPGSPSGVLSDRFAGEERDEPYQEKTGRCERSRRRVKAS